MGRSGRATIHIDGPPARVYELITDISRMGEWSPETVKTEWVGGATGPVPGARFKGSNKLGLLRWSTKPVVEVAEQDREFTFATAAGNADKKYTRWSYKLTPSGGGTDLEESWEELAQIPVIGRFMMSDNRERQLNEGCAKTLARIKAAAERA